MPFPAAVLISPGSLWLLLAFYASTVASAGFANIHMALRITQPSIDRYKRVCARDPAAHAHVSCGSECLSSINTCGILQSAHRSVYLASKLCGAMVGGTAVERS